MSRFQNQENNWAYILLLLIITTIASVGILKYTQDTINEINYLSSKAEIIYYNQ